MSVERPRVLVVQHEDVVPVRMLGDWLRDEGCELVLLRPDRGDRVPVGGDLATYDAVVVLGGTMDSWDDAGHPWFPDTRALVREAAATAVPLLGVCLGHQLAVQAFGGSVGRNPAGRTAAVLPVGWLPPATDDDLVAATSGGGTGVAVHHNTDVATRLPVGATILAAAPDGTAQVVRFAGTVWGVQCHPEADAAVVAGWEELAGDAADPAVVAEVADHEDRLVRTWRPLATALAELARREATRRTVADR